MKTELGREAIEQGANPYQSPEARNERMPCSEAEPSLDDKTPMYGMMSYCSFIGSALVFGSILSTHFLYQRPPFSFRAFSFYQIIWCLMMVNLGIAMYLVHKRTVQVFFYRVAIGLGVTGLSVMTWEFFAGW